MKSIRQGMASIWIGTAILFAVVIGVVFAGMISIHNPYKTDVENRLTPPTVEHILGTDHMGRDVFSRALYGGRKTLITTFISTVAMLAIGIVLGTTAGYFEDSVYDIVLLRIIDSLMGFPLMILAMIITALFGTGLIHLLFAIICVKWIPFARLSRSICIKVKNDISVLAAKVAGASNIKIIFNELLPQIFAPVFTLATFELGNLILSISALSFFGLGAKPPIPEWGAMLADSKPHFFKAPHLVIGTSIFIFLTVFALNLIGEGFRDRYTPYDRARIK